MGKITLTIHKPKETASEIIRIAPEAAEEINKLILQTGLSIRYIASTLIVQGAKLVNVVEE